MNLETNTKIETIYDFLDESGYPYLSNDEEYKEKQFEVDYNGLKLIVTRSNNMDADDEQLIPNTFSYFIKVGGRVINNSAKDVPKILDYLKSRYADGLADGSNTTFDGSNPDIRYAEGGSIPDSLSSQEVENKLGRKLHWWNDDVVYLSGIKYKKVYLKNEYKKV